MATCVFLRVAQPLPERAHPLVDEGRKWGAVVALKAGMVQVVILIALKVILVAAVACSGAEREMDEQPQEYEGGGGQEEGGQESVAEVVQVLNCGWD